MFENALKKTRSGLRSRLAGFWSGSQIAEDQWEELEDILIQADLGLAVAASVVDRLKSATLRDEKELNAALRNVLLSLLLEPAEPNLSGRPLSVILVIGANGTGKTTTIAKLAYRLSTLHQRRVLLAAADTFRAAAVEQLQIWGERVAAPVVHLPAGSDPAAVVHEAGVRAVEGQFDLLIIDTAGRLHHNADLMSQLQKIRKVATRIAPDAPHETWLVLDGTTGQNAIQQAKQFREMLQISGVIVSKLDSSARGGVIVSVCHDLALPIPYIGMGEQLPDLLPFSPTAFVDGLVSDTKW
ncbi:MAG: signal recognition particle-docking protein FtsY [Anaerolineaceae bacterium]|nr:signal recognition particle-docking protein FtsY [Anaerolineaceae bacterium]